MIDLHCHILPGLDDGPADAATMLAMARLAVDDGIETVVATPHVNFHYDYELAEIGRRVVAANALFAEQGLPLELLPGAELDIARLAEIGGAELRGLTLGRGRALLVESPYAPVAGPLDELVYDLQLQGYAPVLAHPERSPVFQSDRARLERLVERGVLCSITAGSIEGAFGQVVRRTALGLLARGLVHNVSSDAHDPDRRPPTLGSALREAVRHRDASPELARWLTLEAPEAIVSGDSVPTRPDPPHPRRWSLPRLLR